MLFIIAKAMIKYLEINLINNSYDLMRIFSTKRHYQKMSIILVNKTAQLVSSFNFICKFCAVFTKSRRIYTIFCYDNFILKNTSFFIFNYAWKNKLSLINS